MTPAAAAKQIRRLKKRLEKEIDHAEEMAQRYALRQAKSLSRGRVKSSSMIKTRPFARRHPAPLLPAHIINLQTGLFITRWRTKVQQPSLFSGGSQERVVLNDAPYADFMRGTRLMHRRPIDDVVRDRWSKERTRRIERSIEKLGLK